ncbi:VOC family protein [Luteibacter aegosomatissinici]|uniref:VOC family protein n=1 Tax=Luteibacter aegosomatissinici TaxID=2911539 RepID=UPI001FFB91E4|nr:VOC family protein [Luteibacter aegosomatissinici]UPG96474.1 VOC family protein [Luteibacter aegosomatissinici]
MATYEPFPFPLTLEIIVLPVADPDRSKAFYSQLGWRLDADFANDKGFRVIQFTPPQSGCSIHFGDKMTAAKPGSVRGLHLVAHDVVAVRDELRRRGIETSEVFHDADGLFHHGGNNNRVDGPNPERKSYASFVSFNDPDGNEWVVQEITGRLSGRLWE